MTSATPQAPVQHDPLAHFEKEMATYDVMVERAVWYWNDRELNAFSSVQAAECAIRRYTRIGFAANTKVDIDGNAFIMIVNGEPNGHKIVVEQRSITME